MTIRIVTPIREMQRLADGYRAEGRTIGLVPTMGYFHEGHLSLMRIAREKADVVVVSHFVNPTQFGANEDLDRYPRDFDNDVRMCEEAGVDIVFAPTADEMYPPGYQTSVALSEIPKHLCGASRPVHFGGVATVCTKLFFAVKPHFAVFGEKDYQQLQVLRRLVIDLNIDTEIVPGPLYREEDGLAMSSRNANLSPAHRERATAMFEGLLEARRLYREGEREAAALENVVKERIEQEDLLDLDYVHVVDPETMAPVTGRIENGARIVAAVQAGAARLIDNLALDDTDQ